jgi:hypothetical protein
MSSPNNISFRPTAAPLARQAAFGLRHDGGDIPPSDDAADAPAPAIQERRLPIAPMAGQNRYALPPVETNPETTVPVLADRPPQETTAITDTERLVMMDCREADLLPDRIAPPDTKALRESAKSGDVDRLRIVLKKWEERQGSLARHGFGATVLRLLVRRASTFSQFSIVHFLQDTYGQFPDPEDENPARDSDSELEPFSYWIFNARYHCEDFAAQDFQRLQLIKEDPPKELFGPARSRQQGTDGQTVEQLVKICEQFLVEEDRYTCESRIPVFDHEEQVYMPMDPLKLKKKYTLGLESANRMMFHCVASALGDIWRMSRNFVYSSKLPFMPGGIQLLMMVAVQLSLVPLRIRKGNCDTSEYSEATRNALDDAVGRQADGLVRMAQQIMQRYWIDFFGKNIVVDLCLKHTGVDFATDEHGLGTAIVAETGLSGAVANLLARSWSQAALSCRDLEANLTISPRATFAEVAQTFLKARRRAIKPAFIAALDRNLRSRLIFPELQKEMDAVADIDFHANLCIEAFAEYHTRQMKIIRDFVDGSFARQREKKERQENIPENQESI